MDSEKRRVIEVQKIQNRNGLRKKAGNRGTENIEQEWTQKKRRVIEEQKI